MARTAETRRERTFKSLALLFTVVYVCVLTTARSVPVSDRTFARTRDQSGPGRELRGVYQLEACAWIQGGFSSGAGVCELNPQYGRVLLETTSHPLKDELFEEGECFISGQEECDNRPYCTWLLKTDSTPGRCVYEKAPGVAEECTAEGMKAFSETLTECRNQGLNTCSKHRACTKVGEEGGLQRCGLEASSALKFLTDSEIDQIELLSALIEGARALHWMDVPEFIVPEGFDFPGQGRRLLQDVTKLGTDADINGGNSAVSQIGFSSLSSDGGSSVKGNSADGANGFGISPQEDNSSSPQNLQDEVVPPAGAPAPSPSDDLGDSLTVQPPAGLGKDTPSDGKAKSGSPKAKKAAAKPKDAPESSLRTGNNPVPKGRMSTTAHTGPNVTASASSKQTSAGTKAPDRKRDKKGSAESTKNTAQKGKTSITAMTTMTPHNGSNPALADGDEVQEGPLDSQKRHEAVTHVKARVPSGSRNNNSRPIELQSAPPTVKTVSTSTDLTTNNATQESTAVDILQDSSGSSNVSVTSNGGGPDGSLPDKEDRNSTSVPETSSPDRSASSFLAAVDDPKKLTVEEEQNTDAVPPLAGGGRTQNTEVAVVPFSSGLTDITSSPSPGVLTTGFGAVIAGGTITGGLGSGFTGKSSDETVSEPTSKDGKQRQWKAKALATILVALEDMSSLFQTAPESEEGKQLVTKMAKSLENLRYTLDAEYTKSTFSWWNEVDAWWWKIQLSLQELAETPQPGLTMHATKACTIKEVAEDVHSKMEELDLTDQLEKLETLVAMFEEMGGECESEQVVESDGEEEFEDLIKIVIQSVNDSVNEVYPVHLDGAFAAEYNQSWVGVVAQRTQVWNAIRQNISAVSTVGRFVKQTARRMLLTLPFAKERSTNVLINVGEVPTAASRRGEETSRELEPRLDDLVLLMDDFVGVLVAIFEGNYTLASVEATENTPGLDDWQLGPVTVEAVIDAVDRAAFKTRSLQALDGNAQQQVVDGVIGIVQNAISIMVAKVSPRAKQGQSLPPSPQASMIVNMLSSIETLMQAWMGFVSINGGGSIPGGLGGRATEAVMNLAGCLALGGNSEETCSVVELPTTHCIRREAPGAGQPRGSQKIPNGFCMPQRDHQVTKLMQKLHSVPEEHRGDLSGGISDLLDAAALCAARERLLCEVDDMCIAKNVTFDSRKETVCRVAPSFVNKLVEEKSIVGFVGKNKSCKEYLSRPTCAHISSSADCSAAEKCIWIPSEARITSQAVNPVGTTGEQRQPNPGVKSGQNPSTSLSLTGVMNGIERPGYCVEDWVTQMESIIEESPERVLSVVDKNAECKTQITEESCGAVDAEQKSLASETRVTIPKGNTRISLYVALSVSVGGTLLFVAVLAIVWKVVKGKNGKNTAKMKKGGRKGSGKGDGNSWLSSLLKLLCFPFREGGKKVKGKRKAQKKNKGKANVPVATVRDWCQPSVIPPPAFVSTTIPISEPGGLPSLQDKTKNMSDFGFVLGSIEGSADSQNSAIEVHPTGGKRRRPRHITSEIEPASESERSDIADSDCESEWSESASSTWTDVEDNEPRSQPDWSSLPQSRRVQE